MEAAQPTGSSHRAPPSQPSRTARFLCPLSAPGAAAQLNIRVIIGRCGKKPKVAQDLDLLGRLWEQRPIRAVMFNYRPIRNRLQRQRFGSDRLPAHGLPPQVGWQPSVRSAETSYARKAVIATKAHGALGGGGPVLAGWCPLKEGEVG